jgi:hypothetical protein
MEVIRGEFPFPWLQVSDDSILIMLRLVERPLCSLTYCIAEPQTIVTQLEQKGIEFTIKANPADMVNVLYYNPTRV